MNCNIGRWESKVGGINRERLLWVRRVSETSCTGLILDTKLAGICRDQSRTVAVGSQGFRDLMYRSNSGHQTGRDMQGSIENGGCGFAGFQRPHVQV